MALKMTTIIAVFVRLLKRTLEKVSEIKAVRDGSMLYLFVAFFCLCKQENISLEVALPTLATLS